MMATNIRLLWEGGEVSGAWQRPRQEKSACLVLGHGAAYTMNSRLMIDIGAELATRGIAVLRFNFPYAEAGRGSPDPEHRLEACFRSVAEIASNEGLPLFLGGKSLGGRIASQVAAEGFPVAGLVFLGYPLHAPGNPKQLMHSHLTEIEAPMLFLQGTRDPFAKPALLRSTVATLRAAKLAHIQNGDHSFKVPGRTEEEIVKELSKRTADFLIAQVDH